VGFIFNFHPKPFPFLNKKRPQFPAKAITTKSGRLGGGGEMQSRKRGQLHYSALVQLAMNMHGNITLHRIIL